jgi:4-amino-4-deoxy-L-arabinose transferase-like glycosyltransferase
MEGKFSVYGFQFSACGCVRLFAQLFRDGLSLPRLARVEERRRIVNTRQLAERSKLKTENSKLKTALAYVQPSKLAKRDFVLLLAGVALVYFYGLGRAPFVGSDEPRYAEVAREMYARGDLVTPTLGGRTWFEKPALGYWSEIAGFKLFGVSEWSARLGAALAGWLTVLLLGWLCGRVERASGGALRGLRLACAGVAASSAGLIAFSRVVNFDIFLTATVTLSLACFFISGLESDEHRRRLLLAGFYAGVGLALLAKGLVGIVIPFGVVGGYQLLLRRFPSSFKSLFWGAPLTLLVAAIWYAPVTLAHGDAFIDQFFIQHHFARFVSNKFHHPQPVYFYLLILPLLSLPWTPFFFAALKNLWHALRKRRGATDDDDAALRLRLFALAWVAVPVAFFSLSQSKLPGYILPALPGAALLAGHELWRFVRGDGNRWAMRATGIILVALACAVIIYSSLTGRIGISCALVVAMPLVFSGIWALLMKGSRERLAGVVVGASLLMVMLAASCALGGAARRESVRDLLRLADARGYGASPVLNLYSIERSSEFYAAGRVVYDEHGEPKMFDGTNLIADYARERGETVLVIVPVEHVHQLNALEGARVEVIGDNGVHALVAVGGSK